MVRRILVIATMTVLATSPGWAQEYAIQGDLALSQWWWSETFRIVQFRADHRLYYDWGEFSLRHRVRSIDLPNLLVHQLVHQLDQAVVTVWPVDALTVQMGRFTMPWGVAYAFHPGDAIHPVRTPQGDVPGLDGAAVTWTITPDWGMAGVVRTDTANGDNGYRGLRWGGQVAGYAGGVELVLAGVYQPDVILRPSVGVSPTFGPVVLHVEAAVELIGRDTPSEFNPTEFEPAEFGIPGVLGGTTGWAVATGGNYHLTAGRHSITLLGEYVYSDSPPDGFGKHGLYPRITWDWDARLNLDQAALVDLAEERALLTTTATWTLYDALELATEIIYRLDQSSGWSRDALGITARVYF